MHKNLSVKSRHNRSDRSVAISFVIPWVRGHRSLRSSDYTGRVYPRPGREAAVVICDLWSMGPLKGVVRYQSVAEGGRARSINKECAAGVRAAPPDPFTVNRPPAAGDHCEPTFPVLCCACWTTTNISVTVTSKDSTLKFHYLVKIRQSVCAQK